MPTVKYYGLLKEKIGVSQEQLGGATVRAVLAQLNIQHGKQVYQVAKSGLITVNGMNAALAQGFSTVLMENDVVCLMPVCCGG